MAGQVYRPGFSQVLRSAARAAWPRPCYSTVLKLRFRLSASVLMIWSVLQVHGGFVDLCAGD